MSVHPARETLARAASLPLEDRRAVLEHVERCTRCREIFAAEDPTRLFSLLANHGPGQDLLDAVSAAVVAGLDQGQPAAGRFRRIWTPGAAAALAAAVVLAVALLLFRGDMPRGPAVADQPFDPAAVALAPRATVSLLDSPGEAQVVDLTVGDTQLVMIFDEELDL